MLPVHKSLVPCAVLCLLALLSSDGSLAAQEAHSDSQARALGALDILPVGEESHGVHLPDHDFRGNQTSLMTAKTALRVNETNIELDEMTLSLNQPEPHGLLVVVLPEARYEIHTAMLFGLRDTLIYRDDFVLTGDTLEFNTTTNTGSLHGDVRMVVKKSSPAAEPAEAPTP